MKKSNVFLALDVDSKKEAFLLVEKWSPYIVGFKVGPRLGFLLNDQDWKWLSERGKIFLDYKFFDIPSTVESAVKRAFDMGVSFCTVHSLNGNKCLKKLSDLQTADNKVLCVTLLTSFDKDSNPLPLSEGVASDVIVKNLTDVVFQSGLSGVVCSAHETSFIKAENPNSLLVCPGIRFSWDENDDQSRVVDPVKAFKDGADYLVMGRSLIRAITDEQFDKALKVFKECSTI